ncbi:Rhomboid- protein 3 [Goodea atripinnis]|uniref:rhomboid protease n=1 Tax=Goodea atripinnis TaxID=208336 RepID=A0ABV0Q289_9TELE
MTAPVVGSSGGVYALVSAHLANVVMNWSGMKCQFKLFRMAMALVCSKLGIFFFSSMFSSDVLLVFTRVVRLLCS